MRVIEGHQLQGNDIKPVVTVLIGQHRFRTRIRTGNNPYYNEVTPGGDAGTRCCPVARPHPSRTLFQVFCQNFRRTPAQLAAEPIHIQVRAGGAGATAGPRRRAHPRHVCHPAVSQVLDSRATRAKATIGTFQVSAGPGAGDTPPPLGRTHPTVAVPAAGRRHRLPRPG